MWNNIFGIALLLVVLAQAVARVNTSSSSQQRRPTEGRPILRINTLKGSSSSSSSTSTFNPAPRTIRKQQRSVTIRKLPKDDITGAEDPAMEPGGAAGPTEDAEKPDDGTANNDSEIEQICATATSDGTALTTDNNLAIQYEYLMFTDQGDNANTVLDLGNQVNLQITEYLQQLYIVNFCLDYMGGGDGRNVRHHHRHLNAGDVRAVVPGVTALQTDRACDAVDDNNLPCVYLISSVTVHFAPYYVIESADDVGKLILEDVERGFKQGVGLSGDANVAGLWYEDGSLGTGVYDPETDQTNVGEPDNGNKNDGGPDNGNNNGNKNEGEPDNGNNNDGGSDNGNRNGNNNGNHQEDSNADNTQTGNGSNGQQANGGTANGTEQGATDSDTAESEEKMSRAGKFFLTVFILGLIGALIYVCWKLHRVEKGAGDNDGGDDFRDLVTERVKHWRDRMQQWHNDGSRGIDGSSDRIKMADTEDDDEEDQHLRVLPHYRAEPPYESKTEKQRMVKAKSWVTAIKNNIFDSERAEEIPRRAPHTSVLPSKSSMCEGFSVYGKEDEGPPNLSFFSGKSGNDPSKVSHMFITNTMDTSTTEGDGTEIILEDLAKGEPAEKKQSFIRKVLPYKSDKEDEYKQSESEQNISTWSYNTKNFSLSDIQILVDDADESADASNVYSRRTYYMPDTVQL